jgi:ABC-2 type transport system ATP-binding protein
MSVPILEVSNLVKNYGSFCAVDHISFNVPKGCVIGLLGPNGAGKTTTIQMLLGITLYNGGVIKYFGKDFSKNKEFCLKQINYASAFNTLQGRITVFENLLVFSKLYDVKNPHQKIRELTEYFEISDLLSQIYFNLSAGQKTRVNIIKSLLNDPGIILMDEPTASLDPDIADKTLTLIEQLRKDKDLSILFTSHDMTEVTRICDEVIFLDHGRIVAQDTPIGLTKKITAAKLQIIFDGKKEILENFLKGNYKYQFENPNLLIITTEEKLLPQLIFKLSKLNITITDIEIKKSTLEDVFLQIARGENYVP